MPLKDFGKCWASVVGVANIEDKDYHYHDNRHNYGTNLGMVGKN